MIHDDKHMVPLSPPMSDADGKLNEYSWLQAQDTLLEPVVLLQESPVQQSRPVEFGLGLDMTTTDQPVADVMQQALPSLGSHGSFLSSLATSGSSKYAVSQVPKSPNALADFKDQVVYQRPQPTGTHALPQPSYGDFGPTSPIGRLTPNTPSEEWRDAGMEDDEMDLDAAELDDEEEAARPPKTAAELRAQKRKMKRFRLTHNQTRFLMSEFARQAHPDAAHRERLSREIPGLSPRQVQVWFQNRRAKLKHLPTDDRESMMRSRVLPAGFDMAQALHAPYGAPTPTGTIPPVSVQTFPSYGASTGAAPLTLDTTRRSSVYQPPSQHFSSPSGITPAIDGFAFTPPQSATEATSPAFAVGGSSIFNFRPSDSPRRIPYGSFTGAQSAYVPQSAYTPRVRGHERFGRPAPEAAGSPLRASLSYSGLNTGSAFGARSTSFSEQSSYTHERRRQSHSNTITSAGGAGSYGLGFSLDSQTLPTYRPIQPQPPPNQTTTPSHLPATLDAYRCTTTQTPTTPVTYTDYVQPNYSTPQYSYYSNIYGSQPSYANYHQHVADLQGQRAVLPSASIPHAQQPYAPIVTASAHFGVLVMPAVGAQDPGDNSDGGVAVGDAF